MTVKQKYGKNINLWITVGTQTNIEFGRLDRIRTAPYTTCANNRKLTKGYLTNARIIIFPPAVGEHISIRNTCTGVPILSHFVYRFPNCLHKCTENINPYNVRITHRPSEWFKTGKMTVHVITNGTFEIP